MRSIAKVQAAALALAITSQAGAQVSRDVLPIPDQPFQGEIRERATDSKPDGYVPVRAPRGAPNLFVMMSDDVGFGMTSAFGGPVPTPNYERLAREGQRYNRFHTTGICSPSRAALLTGRNHHNAGTGYLTDSPTGFPGYSARIPVSTATIAQTLRLNGYNTAMFGKHHNVPPGEDSAAGPFDYWPTGLGFEYFYGIVSADSDQWSPNLYRGTNLVPSSESDGALMDKHLADDAINWIHNQKAAAPDKPFLIYFAPVSTHAPHQAPAEYIARFKGRFDLGWDKLREETHRRQLTLGIIPPGTVLTPRPEGIPAWDALTPEQKAFAAKSMEVAAAQLTYQDEQVGRVLAELDRMGELKNTLVITVHGDNGASGEAGPRGTLNEVGVTNGIDEDDSWLSANIERLGGPQTYGNYPVGWAWAMNAPLRWTKQYASMLGGVRNGMVMSWPGHVRRPGGVCAQFGHLVDIAPTVLEAAGLPAPSMVLGVVQKPLDGQSLVSSLDRCDPNEPRTQYFELTGKIGLFHNGWFASKDDGRRSWERANPRGETELPWELYDLRNDFSQARNVAAEHPEQLQKLIGIWKAEAARNNVFPLDNRFGSARGLGERSARKQYVFWGKDVSVPTRHQPNFTGRSFTIDAELNLAQADASGPVVALGSRFAGWTLFLDKGRPSFFYTRSTKPSEGMKIAATRTLPVGRSNLRLTFNTQGLRQAATFQLSSNGEVLAEGGVDKTFLVPAGLGETLDIGRDLGVPVINYGKRASRIEGDVSKVTVTFP